MVQKAFHGVVNVDVRDSVPDWAPFQPAVAPEHAMAHHRPVFAEPVVPVDRPQPHPQQHGVHHGGCDRVPERQRHDSTGERHAVRDPRRRRLEHLRGRQVAPVSGSGDEPGRVAPQLADRERVRAVLRVPGRRDEPVVSGSGPRQPSGGAAGVAGGGLPLHRGHHRQGAGVHQGRERRRAGEAFLPVLRARGGARAASRAQGVDRPVPRAVRSGVRGDARTDPGPTEGARAHSGRHRAATGQPGRDAADAHRPGRQAVPHHGLHQALGFPRRRREASVRPHGRGLRRVPRTRRPPHRAVAGLSGRRRHAREHDGNRGLRQRRQR